MQSKCILWAITLTLAGLGMIGPFATDTYLPSFQEIGAEFGVPEVVVQQTLSIYLLFFAAMSLIYGSLSDMFGRKSIIFAGLGIFFCSSLMAALAPNFEVLFIARALQGLSAGAGVVVGQAIVRDMYGGSTAQQLMANIAMVFSLAPAIAPILGGYIAQHLGWRFVFFFVMAYSVGMILMSWKFLPESLPQEKRQPLDFFNLIRQYKESIKDKAFLSSALGTGFSFGGQATYIACASNIIINILHMKPTDFGWLFIPMISGTVIGSWLSGRLANRYSTHLIINIGLTVMAVGAVLDLFCAKWTDWSVPYCFLPVTCYVIGMSIARPGMVIVALGMRPKTLGLASSLVAFSQTVIFALISGLIAPLLFGSLTKMALSLALCSLLSIGLWIIGQHLHKSNRPSSQSIIFSSKKNL